MKTNLSFSRASAGTSSRSLRLRAGSITVLMPARSAASTFSLTPPIGSTRPRSEISPVIATSLAPACRSAATPIARNIATPAHGPSFGVAPAGTWIWRSILSSVCPVESVFATVSAACADSFITSPSWPVRISLPCPASARLDEQDVAADRRPGKAGRHAGDRGTQRHLVLEARCAERVLHVLRIDGDRDARRAFRDLHRRVAQTKPSSRSRLRTPASRVYSAMMVRRPSSVNSMRSA